MPDKQKFGQMLASALWSIKREKAKPISVVQDEIGYELGYAGGSVIEYWKKGNLPTDPIKLKRLIACLARRTQIERSWAEEIWRCTDFPGAAEVLDRGISDERINVVGVERIPRSYREFVGRKQDFKLLNEALIDTDGRYVISLEGIGGIGKSALAQHVAHEFLQQRRFDTVIWESAARDILGEFYEKESLPLTLDSIIDSIGRNLGDPRLLQMTGREREERIHSLLARNRVLVILDNLETARDSQERLAAGLQSYFVKSSSKLLLTSRQRFGTDIFPVRLTGLETEDGLQFIRQEAREKNIETITQAKSEQLQRIVRDTGGSPLAMKLVIGQLRILPLDIVLDRLQQVSETKGEVDEYSRFYRYLFQPSWELLSHDSKVLLVSLAHFIPTIGGSFRAIQATSGLNERETGKSIKELFRYSFLEIEAISTIDDTHYFLHPLTYNFIHSDLLKFE